METVDSTNSRITIKIIILLEISEDSVFLIMTSSKMDSIILEILTQKASALFQQVSLEEALFPSQCKLRPSSKMDKELHGQKKQQLMNMDRKQP